MNGESVCRELQALINQIDEGKGTAEDVEKIRAIVNNWDEYACWGDDR